MTLQHDAAVRGRAFQRILDGRPSLALAGVLALARRRELRRLAGALALAGIGACALDGALRMAAAIEPAANNAAAVATTIFVFIIPLPFVARVGELPTGGKSIARSAEADNGLAMKNAGAAGLPQPPQSDRPKEGRKFARGPCRPWRRIPATCWLRTNPGPCRHFGPCTSWRHPCRRSGPCRRWRRRTSRHRHERPWRSCRLQRWRRPWR